ncbi:transglycosylase SLT domain-containing protein [Vreelandella rituensis]|uniref:Transglycosylase SLT domain-containing protein n=1 Tax=Vreelandella rituensis TaxID=2282306 RepID=A0A368UA06_9GAMM|nr:transglycosylase SLT domain-containing protein [Halomonas rituensis]RCV93835.1 hypothetical protein DU506_01370 [Halomonas rituensis]
MRSLKVCLVALGVAAMPVSAMASIHDFQCLTADMTGDENARQLYIAATSEAARTFNIAPAIMVAIKRTESGRGLNPLVTNRNNNGTTDRGYYQVNAEVWLPELRRIGLPIANADLHGVRANALIAAWVYKRQLARVKDPLEAVGYYHKGGGTGPGSERIRKVYKDKFIGHLRAMVSRCGMGTGKQSLVSR